MSRRFTSTHVLHSEPILLGLASEGLQLKVSDNVQYVLSHHQCRENCRCNLCTLQPSRHRNVNNSGLIINNDSFQQIQIKEAGIDKDNKYIYLKWSDNHEGWIDLEELLDEDLDDVHHANDNAHNGIDISLWRNEPHNMTHYDYNDLIWSDDILFNSFYDELDRNGMCLVTNSPSTEGIASSMGRRLGNHLYPTVFGDSFVVDIKEDSVSPAYTNLELPTHTDLPYYVLSPEYFVFHCIQNEGTGNSIYNDGFCIAQEMRTHYAEQFEILSTVSVPFRDHQKGKWDYVCYKKLIQLNEENNEIIDKIHYNEGVRSSIHWKISNNLKKDFYHALSIFSRMTFSPEFIFERQLESGDIFIFNNGRVLHGRRGFEGGRKMEGCFFTKQALQATKNQLKFGFRSAHNKSTYNQ